MKKNSHLIKHFRKKAYFLMGLLLMFCMVNYGQNQKLADSLEQVYSSGDYKKEDLLSILRGLAHNNQNPDKSIQYSEILLQKAKQLDSVNSVISAYRIKGSALRLKGDLSKALESFLLGAKIALDEKNSRELGKLYITIADVYSVMENKKNTILYYKKAIALLKEEKDSLNYAFALENLGDEYNLNLRKPDTALILFKESGKIFKSRNHKSGMAFNLGNVGLAYALKGENSKAEENISKAILLLNELGDYYPICVYLTYMSDIYADKGNLKAAFTFAQRSLELAKQYGLKSQISDANLKLSELYQKIGDIDKSFRYYKDYIIYKDSVENISSVQQMANFRTDFEISRKQIEVDLLNQQKDNQQIIVIVTAISLFLIVLLTLGLYRRNRFIKRTNGIIQKERDRSENLLLNILPEETAMELKEFGRVKAKKFESVTVLFTDFEGFTRYSEGLSPEELVASVDFYYSKFDEIMEKYGLEKIKTVGDAYMCAGGLPFPTENHAHKMLLAAFEIKEFVAASKIEETNNGTRFNIRIGINTGPVVAGVVGTKKFAYDIWGDTVNVASRMESLSEPGKINISENTYGLVKDAFECVHRGEIFVRNKGMMKMYFVNETSQNPI
ncbi:MAG: adenylate cyclase [Psychroserpens sp.]|jgi:adenylate cyclase